MEERGGKEGGDGEGGRRKWRGKKEKKQDRAGC